MNDYLDNCPFCGEEEEIWICLIPFRNIFAVQCQRCGSMGPKVERGTCGLVLPENGEKEAIKRWNQRGKQC